MNKEMIDASSYDVGLIALIDRFAQFQNECADLFIEIAALHNDSDSRLVTICCDQFNFIAARSSALIELIKLGAVWDAQILARPIIESTVKISFLCFSAENERAQLCREFEEVLGAINTLKLHDKAQKTLDAIGRDNTHPTLKSLILSKPKLQELHDMYPREFRKKVEQRWGFTRMVVTLDQSFQHNFEISPFASLLHTYGLSSHLIHADETGLGTIRARNRLKEEPNRTAVLQSHRVALLDAVAGAAMISAISLAWASKKMLGTALALTEKYAKVHWNHEQLEQLGTNHN